MSALIPHVLLLLVVRLESREKLVQLMEPHTLTKVSLPVPQLSPTSGMAVEVRLEDNNNYDNKTTVFFTTVFNGELHTWSLQPWKERLVRKFLCTQTQTDHVRGLEVMH